MEFSRQEYRSELPFPSPGDLPDPGIKPMSPALQADSLPLSHLGSPKGRWAKWPSWLLNGPCSFCPPGYFSAFHPMSADGCSRATVDGRQGRALGPEAHLPAPGMGQQIGHMCSSERGQAGIICSSSKWLRVYIRTYSCKLAHSCQSTCIRSNTFILPHQTHPFLH